MRSRPLAVVAIAALTSLSASGRAQSSPLADGLVPGDYLRIGAGMVSPFHPQGSLRDWDRGQTANVAWENWQSGSNGVGVLGFALGIDYSRLPLNQNQFLADFETEGGARATSAHASSAQIFALSTILRARIPSPLLMPTLSLGFGILNYQPANIDYNSPAGNGTVGQKHRTGASVSFGGGADKQVYDRAALFGEAVYTYAFTSLGQGLATPGGICAANGCDALKNTSIVMLRGGLRLRFGR